MHAAWRLDPRVNPVDQCLGSYTEPVRPLPLSSMNVNDLKSTDSLLVQSATPVGHFVHMNMSKYRDHPDRFWREEKGTGFLEALQDYKALKQPWWSHPANNTRADTPPTVALPSAPDWLLVYLYTGALPGRKEALHTKQQLTRAGSVLRRSLWISQQKPPRDMVKALCMLGLDLFLKLRHRWVRYSPEGTVYRECQSPYLFALFDKDYTTKNKIVPTLSYTTREWRACAGLSPGDALQGDSDLRALLSGLTLPQFLVLFCQGMESFLVPSVAPTRRDVYRKTVLSVIKATYGNSIRLCLISQRARFMVFSHQTLTHYNRYACNGDEEKLGHCLTQYIPRLRHVGTRKADSKSNVKSQLRSNLPQMWYHLGLHPSRLWYDTADEDFLVHTLLFMVPTGQQHRVLKHWLKLINRPSPLSLCGGLLYLADGQGVMSLRRLTHTFTVLGNQLRRFPAADKLQWRFLSSLLKTRIPVLPLHSGMLWQFETPLFQHILDHPYRPEAPVAAPHPRLLYTRRTQAMPTEASFLAWQTQDALPRSDTRQPILLAPQADPGQKQLWFFPQSGRCPRSVRIYGSIMAARGAELMEWLTNRRRRRVATKTVLFSLLRTDWWSPADLIQLVLISGLRLSPSELATSAADHLQGFTDAFTPLIAGLDQVRDAQPWHTRDRIDKDDRVLHTYCEDLFDCMLREARWVSRDEQVMELQPESEFSGDESDSGDEDDMKTDELPAPGKRKKAASRTETSVGKKVRFAQSKTSYKLHPDPHRPLQVRDCVRQLVENELRLVYEYDWSGPFRHRYHNVIALLRPSYRLLCALQHSQPLLHSRHRRLLQSKFKVKTNSRTVLLADLHEERRHFLVTLCDNLDQIISALSPFEPDALYSTPHHPDMVYTYDEYDKCVRPIVETEQALQIVQDETVRIFAQSTFLDAWHDPEAKLNPRLPTPVMHKLHAVMTLLPRLTGVSTQTVGLRAARGILRRLTAGLDLAEVGAASSTHGTLEESDPAIPPTFPDKNLQETMADDVVAILQHVSVHKILPLRLLQEFIIAYGANTLNETLKVMLGRTATCGEAIFLAIKNTLQAARENRIINHPMFDSLSVFEPFRREFL